MVCAAIAQEAGYVVHALTVDYGQRHRVEIEASKAIARHLDINDHQVAPLDMRLFGGSALTADIEVPKEGVGEDIPVTYMPARNLLFLSLALSWAEALGGRDIYIGVNAVDYSGYPDCRPEFIDAFQHLAGLATKAGVEGHPVRISTPLMALSKAEIIRRGTELGLDYSLTVSCYQADAEGRACGRCDSCRLRREGFEQALIKDPTIYQS